MQLQPNWRSYLQLDDEMLTNGMYKTYYNHRIEAFCVLLMTALLRIPQHIIGKHQQGTQVFSKTTSFLLMTLDSQSGQTHNQYRSKQPITNLYTSQLIQKYTITKTKVHGASLHFRTGVRLTMHVAGLFHTLWDEKFFMVFIHGLLGLNACWWIIPQSILLDTTIQSIL